MTVTQLSLPSGRVTWGNYIQLGQSYQLNRLIVGTYRGNCQLPLPASAASVEPIQDIGEVADDSFDLDQDTLLQVAQVMGVSGLEFIFTCKQVDSQICRKLQLHHWHLRAMQNCAKASVDKQRLQTLEQDHITLDAYEDTLRATTNNIT